MMILVNDCRDFVETWNERLDAQNGGSADVARALADHASGCDACGCLNRIYLEIESVPAAWSLIPAPSEPVVNRWRAAAIASRTLPSPFDRRRAIRVAAIMGIVATVAASALICSQASLTLLFPAESVPVVPNRIVGSPPRFEDSFAEARTMTLELAREVSGPAARIGSEVFGWRGKRSVPASDLARFDQDGPSTDTGPGPRSSTIDRGSETAGVESTSGSARYAFRFLIGSSSEGSLKPKTVGGF